MKSCVHFQPDEDHNLPIDGQPSQCLRCKVGKKLPCPDGVEVRCPYAFSNPQRQEHP